MRPAERQDPSSPTTLEGHCVGEAACWKSIAPVNARVLGANAPVQRTPGQDICDFMGVSYRSSNTIIGLSCDLRANEVTRAGVYLDLRVRGDTSIDSCDSSQPGSTLCER